jgi:hypothetical protein
MRVTRMGGSIAHHPLFDFLISLHAHGSSVFFAKGQTMSSYQKSMPWFRRPAYSLIAAPAARLLAAHKREKRIPHDPREIERFRIELELKRSSLDLSYRFKVM